MKSVLLCLLATISQLALAEEFTETTVVRINNQRFEKFTSEFGSLYLSSTEPDASARLKKALCEQHLTKEDVVEFIRNNPDAKNLDEPTKKMILAKIRGCGKSTDRPITSRDELKQKDGVSSSVNVTPVEPESPSDSPGVAVGSKNQSGKPGMKATKSFGIDEKKKK